MSDDPYRSRSPDPHEERHREHEKAIASLNLHRGQDVLKVNDLGKALELLSREFRVIQKPEVAGRRWAFLKSLIHNVVALSIALGGVVYLSWWHNAWQRAQLACVPGHVEVTDNVGKYSLWNRDVVCINGWTVEGDARIKVHRQSRWKTQR